MRCSSTRCGSRPFKNRIHLTRQLLTAFLLCAALLQAANADPNVILELGGAASKNIKEAGSTGGGNIAVEFTAIERWLEIEIGTTPVFAHHLKEWDTDVLFKKPWTLTEKVEFMAGAGPAWVNTRQNNVTRNSLAGEIVADFMFWPSGKHRFGWFVEPSYEFAFGPGHERSIGVSAGLLLGIR